MLRFKGGVSGASPLQIQLGTSALTPAYVVGFSAQGENSSGSASRPVLTRPSTPGTGSGSSISFSSSAAPAQSTIITSFSGAPSIPSVSLGTFNLPLRLRWAAMGDGAFIVGVSSYALLYANAAGGHTWSGELIFEER